MAATVLGMIAKSGGFGSGWPLAAGYATSHIDDWNECIAMSARRAAGRRLTAGVQMTDDRWDVVVEFEKLIACKVP
jgi:nitrate/nitrite transporter NarK